jgi:hypothetical protein
MRPIRMPLRKRRGDLPNYIKSKRASPAVKNMANQAKAKEFERGFFIICRLILIFIQPQ